MTSLTLPGARAALQSLQQSELYEHVGLFLQPALLELVSRVCTRWEKLQLRQDSFNHTLSRLAPTDSLQLSTGAYSLQQQLHRYNSRCRLAHKACQQELVRVQEEGDILVVETQRVVVLLHALSERKGWSSLTALPKPGSGVATASELPLPSEWLAHVLHCARVCSDAALPDLHCQRGVREWKHNLTLLQKNWHSLCSLRQRVQSVLQRWVDIQQSLSA